MASASNNSLKSVEWMWQSNPDPSSKTERAEWSHYSDVENLIIEEAFGEKQNKAILDDYYIDFEHKIHISLTDESKQYPVKRVECLRDTKRLRQERFYDLPTSAERSFGGQYGWISPFIVEVRRSLGLSDGGLPSTNPELVPGLVQKAAQGIIAEGKLLKKTLQAKKLAMMFLETKDQAIKEVWKQCAYLYTLESFLYKSINNTMRLIGNKEDEKLWLSKVDTLGPFCLILWDNPFNEKLTIDKTLYRGAHLEPQQIEKYTEMTRDEKNWGSFTAFSSTSRNRAKAEGYGNTLFIMKVDYAFIADLSPLSEYQDEEEELITPSVCFRVERIEHDDRTNKHLIYLVLRQRFNGEFYILPYSL